MVPDKNIKIISWNVNSIRARLPLLLKLIAQFSPDILLLQETKAEDKNFPFELLSELNYNIANYGQKTYNGVAILSKFPIEDVEHGGFCDEARLVCCFTGGVVVTSVYVINGQEVGCDKYYKKLQFLGDLRAFLGGKLDCPTLVAGDFNVTFDDDDVYNPALWRERITCSALEREKFHELILSGYEDLFRKFNPIGTYTWWDYRHNAITSDRGLRLDYILANSALSPRISEIKVLKSFRSLPRPSDHAPILCTLDSI